MNDVSALKLLLLDVDGVMTDGRKMYDPEATVIGKSYCDLDFTAIKCFKACGVSVALISGDQNVNRAMATTRGLDFIFARNDQGMVCKSTFLPEALARYGCSAAQTAFCGDDIFDVNMLNSVGWSFCPANSPLPVKQAVRHVLAGRSGAYLVMEIFEFFVTQKILTFPTAEEVMEIERKSETVSYAAPQSVRMERK